ncbi:MAG: thioesterase [Lachnospiraceae bacterium]|nr:thioesterase [Lachnospiraceae bacterium]
MYEFSSRVRYSECAPDYSLSLAGLVNYLQDCATFHAENVGRSGQMLKKEGKAWMITNWRIRVDRYPRHGEFITTRTWGHGFKGLEALRNFTVKDAEGNLLAYADSRWCYFDMEEGRPIRIPDVEMEAYGIEEAFPMDRAPRHIKLPDEGYEEKQPFKVRTIHLDANGHVNNEQYISMALAYLPAGLKAREIRVEYLRQAHLGDVLAPRVYRRDGEYIVWLEIGGSVCCVMQFFV